MKEQLDAILSERARLQSVLSGLACVKKMYPTDANFILVDVGDANGIYDLLVNKGVIVRNRTNVTLCNGCLRITVGTSEENQALLAVLETI